MQTRWALVSCVAIVVFLPGVGCKRKDAEKCDNAIKVTRQAADTGDFALARQWREYAYKHCADTAQLQGLDKEIVDKEKAVEEKKQAEAAKAAETDELARVFADWAGKSKAAPASSVSAPTCAGHEDSKERWCTGQRSVSGKYQLTTRYWEAEPEAAQFSVRAPGDVTCDKLGPSTVLKTLNGGARLYCDMTGGALAGMKVLLTRTPEGMVIAAFSQKYLEKDSGLSAIVGG
jgi:hypothetical protein